MLHTLETEVKYLNTMRNVLKWDTFYRVLHFSEGMFLQIPKNTDNTGMIQDISCELLHMSKSNVDASLNGDMRVELENFLQCADDDISVLHKLAFKNNDFITQLEEVNNRSFVKQLDWRTLDNKLKSKEVSSDILEFPNFVNVLMSVLNTKARITEELGKLMHDEGTPVEITETTYKILQELTAKLDTLGITCATSDDAPNMLTVSGFTRIACSKPIKLSISDRTMIKQLHSKLQELELELSMSTVANISPHKDIVKLDRGIAWIECYYKLLKVSYVTLPDIARSLMLNGQTLLAAYSNAIN